MRFREAYDIAVPEKKRKEEKYNTWVAYVVRPLSVICTLPFIKRKTKPTTITAVSIICALIGFFVLVFARSVPYKILGWFGFFAWAILDGVDGNLARCKKESSSLGDLWDTMGGYSAMVLIYYSAGIISFFDTNLIEFIPQYKYIYIILGGFTSIFSIFPRLILHKKKSSQTQLAVVDELTDTSNFSFIKRLAGNLTSPSGIIQVIFLLCLLLNIMNVFLICYFLINLGIMTISLYGLLRE